MAKRKTKRTSDVATLQKQLDAYEVVFDEVQKFIDLINEQDAEIAEATAAMLKAKEKYEAAKHDVSVVKDARDGTKHLLFAYLRPGPSEILPLFDRMEEADEQRHGAHADEWRKEPISALRLSLVATNLLTAADVIFVGQLQDRVQADGEKWWEKIEGLTQPVAAAIVDRLIDFIHERSGDA
jgi:hypothetical protein